MAIKTAVLGVSGYTGQELVRILLKHPQFTITNLYSTSYEGDYAKLAPQLSPNNLPQVELFDASISSDLDLIFLAVPHTKSMDIVRNLSVSNTKLRIIDLSADFRLHDVTKYESYYHVKHSAKNYLADAVYGLPELYKDNIRKTRLCANPGCNATSIILGLLPLKGVIEKSTPISIDAKCAVSGAGKQLKESLLFCEVDGYVSAYETGTHRHMAELDQELDFDNIIFSPHLLPTMRGIESAIYIYQPKITETELLNLFNEYYTDHPFVNVYASDTQPTTRLVNNTNQCAIIPQKKGDWVVVFSLLDNLIKGAAGQAIQNANIMFDIEETSGLTENL